MADKALFLTPDDIGVARAGAILRDGGLVAFPTETVYGLGADATNDAAVARIFAVKGRPQFNPLIVHVPTTAAARALVPLDERAERLAAAYWPGPLTLVLPRPTESPVSLLASAGLGTLAVRVPAHPLAQRLLRAAGRPVAAPSANRSGRISPTRADHVRDELGSLVDAILDGGPTMVGLESTVVDLTGTRPILLRPGTITRPELVAVVGPFDEADGTIRSPGQLASHYAPRLPLRLEAHSAAPDEALLAFGPAVPPGAAATLNLSGTADLHEAAANLFAHLRALDRPGLAAIAVMPIPLTGLGEAINDRLRRAAAPR